MDNTKYYPELSDMAVTLANMVTKKGWQNKNWKNNTENLDGSDIQSFMYHYGNEDIEVHDMSNTYSDANVCRYAIGQHDVFLRRGKVNHKVRNVITVAIGEIPEKTAELTANLYGLLGSDEEIKYISDRKRGEGIYVFGASKTIKKQTVVPFENEFKKSNYIYRIINTSYDAE